MTSNWLFCSGVRLSIAGIRARGCSHDLNDNHYGILLLLEAIIIQTRRALKILHESTLCIFLLPPPDSGVGDGPHVGVECLPIQPRHVQLFHQLKLRGEQLLDGVSAPHFPPSLRVASQPLALRTINKYIVTCLNSKSHWKVLYMQICAILLLLRCPCAVLLTDCDRQPWTIVRRFDQFISALITPHWKVLRS